jgi:hypothetical protein
MRFSVWLMPLGDEAALGVGMTAYFGLTIVQLTVQTVTGTWDPGDDAHPLWFFWIAVTA